VERFIQVLVDGIATGSIYAAVALALVLIFRSTGIVNFAQGEMAMFSTFVAWGLYEGGVPLGLAVLTTLALSFVAGMVIERGLIRHFEGGEVLTLVIVTLGLFILLNSLAGWIWGFENRGFPSLFSDDTVTIGGVRLSVESLGIVAVLTTLALSFVAGMVIERGLIRHFEGGEVLTLVIVTLGLFILLNSLAGWIWGFGTRGFPSLFSAESIEIGGVQLSVESLGIVGVLLAVVGLLFLLFQRTKIGLAMRAAALNPASSALVGVRVGHMLMLGWGMAAALGALAGVLVAPRLFLDVNLMGAVLIYAFAAAALGGFDSPIGAVVGGWVIGVSENLAGTYVDFIGADLKILVPLVIIFVVLLVRPSGLFGTREVARA
jgi:branched-chain amino acid transport system permease protein